MLDKALTELNTDKREPDLGRDRQAGHGGRVICPGVYAKSLLVRPKNWHQHLRHRRLSAMYDYLGDGRAEVALIISPCPLEGRQARALSAGDGVSPAREATRRAGARRPAELWSPISSGACFGAVVLLIVSAWSPSPSSSWCPDWPGRPRSLAARYVGRTADRGARSTDGREARVHRPALRAVLALRSRAIVVGADYDYGPGVEHCPAPCFGYSFITSSRSGPSCSTGCRSRSRSPSARR